MDWTQVGKGDKIKLFKRKDIGTDASRRKFLRDLLKGKWHTFCAFIYLIFKSVGGKGNTGTGAHRTWSSRLDVACDVWKCLTCCGWRICWGLWDIQWRRRWKAFTTTYSSIHRFADDYSTLLTTDCTRGETVKRNYEQSLHNVHARNTWMNERWTLELVQLHAVISWLGTGKGNTRELL